MGDRYLADELPDVGREFMFDRLADAAIESAFDALSRCTGRHKNVLVKELFDQLGFTRVSESQQRKCDTCGVYRQTILQPPPTSATPSALSEAAADQKPKRPR